MLILGYHSIHPLRRDPLAVHPNDFVAQLEWLERKYRIVRLGEVVDAFLAGEKNLRLAALTFDDGLRDNYRYLFPVLKARRIPATIFLALDFIGSEIPFGGENLQRNSEIRRQDLLGLQWCQVREMQAAYVEFGSHTFSHPRLTKLKEPHLSREVTESRCYLAEKLQCAVSWFCYPFGDFDNQVKQVVAAAGYRAAFVTPAIPLPVEDVFSIRRVGVYGHNSLWSLRLKTSRIVRRLKEQRASKPLWSYRGACFPCP